MEPITALEVTLSRVITEDGHMAVRIQHPPDYNVVELLGLLEVAKFQVYREMGREEQ
jgi:hypothetical protein